MTDAISQFRDTIRATGLEPPEVIEPGRLHRFPGAGKGPSNRAGWCKLFDDGLGGCFGDWSTGLSESWQAQRDRPFSPYEQAAFARRVKEAKRQAKTELHIRQLNAANRATAIWDPAPPAPCDHPYLAVSYTHLTLPTIYSV